MDESNHPSKRQKTESTVLNQSTRNNDSTDDEDEMELRQAMEVARQQQQRRVDPPVHGTDARTVLPLKDGITLKDEASEPCLAFCCKICHCPEDIKAAFCGNEYVTPGDATLWHRRCCHYAGEVSEGWLPQYNIARKLLEKRLEQKLLNNEPLDPPTVTLVPAMDVWKKYETQKSQEAELYKDDEQGVFGLGNYRRLNTDPSYQKNRLHFHEKRKELQAQGSSTRQAVVVDLFGGIGSGLVCLKRLGIAIKTVIHVDHDKIANVVYKHNHTDDGINHIFIEKFEEFEENVDQLSHKYGPFNIVIGGPPCVDYTKINANSKGVAGKQGSYLVKMGELVKRMHRKATAHQAPFFFLAENAAMYDSDMEKPLEETDLEKIKSSFGINWSIRFDSREHSPLRRNRTYISNIPFIEDVNARDIPPSTCFDKGCTEKCPENCDECGRFDVAGNIFDPDMIARAPGLMASKGRLDDPRMHIFLENRAKNGKLMFYCRTPTVIERERLIGLPEGYVQIPVDDLFTNLLQNGLDKFWQKPTEPGVKSNHWEDCLPKKYWEFAGDYHDFEGRYQSFRFDTHHQKMKLKLAPPLTTQKPQYYTAEEYGKRLLGNTFSIPTVTMFLKPICVFFEHREYPSFNYDYAWDKYNPDNLSIDMSWRVLELIKEAEEERSAKASSNGAANRQLSERKPAANPPNVRALCASARAPDNSSEHEFQNNQRSHAQRAANHLPPSDLLNTQLESAVQDVNAHIDSLQTQISLLNDNITRFGATIESKVQNAVNHALNAHTGFFEIQHFLKYVLSYQPPDMPPVNAIRQNATIIDSTPPATNTTSYKPDHVIPLNLTKAGNTPSSTTPTYKLYRYHRSVTSMWHEWFGLGQFKTVPPTGGIQGMEEISATWRKGFSTGEQKHFSRLKSIIKSIERRMLGKETREEILAAYDNLMRREHLKLSTFALRLPKLHGQPLSKFYE